MNIKEKAAHVLGVIILGVGAVIDVSVGLNSYLKVSILLLVVGYWIFMILDKKPKK